MARQADRPQQGASSDASGEYTIIVEGVIDPRWSQWFGGMSLVAHESERFGQVTVLSGRVIDQASLRGVLVRLWDLNLTVLAAFRSDLGSELGRPSGWRP